MDPFCYLSFMFVFVMLSFLFLAAMWSPAGKGLNSWFSCVLCFLTVLSLSCIWFSVSSVVLHIGVATIYAKTPLRTRLNKQYRISLSQF